MSINFITRQLSKEISPNNKRLIILGSARSGTSWLCETLSRQSRYRLLFEPEHPNHVKQGKFIADHTRFSLDEDFAKFFFNKVFSNRIDNDWIAQHSYRKYKMHLWPFIPKFFVIKMIRTNLLTSFFLNNYSHPILFVVRNPYQVIHSQNRVKFPWLYDLGVFAKNEKLCSDLYEHTGIVLKCEVFSDFEKLVIRWGIENCLYALPSHPNLFFHKYEDLKKDHTIIPSLMLKVKMEVPDNLSEIIQKPSSKTHKHSTVFYNTSDLTLNQDQKNIVKSILSRFPHQYYVL